MNDLPRTVDDGVIGYRAAPRSTPGDGRQHIVLPWVPPTATPHETSPFGKTRPPGGGVRALLDEAAVQRREEAGRRLHYSAGRFGDRARVGLLAVRQIDALDGATRTLGYVPITGTDYQQAIYRSTPAVPLLPAGGPGALLHTYRLDRLSPDANAKIVESKPIRARTAALVLLWAPEARTAETVLAASGIDGFLDYLREHPIQPPGSTRRHRRAAQRARRRPSQRQEGWV